MKTNSLDQDVGILVIDDHAISRHFAVEALRSVSREIRQARTGYDALAATRNWFPRLVFTDIHLPDVCGLDLVQEIRSAWPQQRSLPHIVIITGDISSRMRQQAKQANVAGLLSKPVRMEDIRAIAQRLLHLDRTVQESSAPGPPTATDNELRKLFARELTTRLPLLDKHITQLNWKPASEILHQLIASSALCGEKELENCSRLLYQAISRSPRPKTIAQAYHPFLQAASRARGQVQFRPDESDQPFRGLLLPGQQKSNGQ
jgi:CheY-like chemotaxis protein